ncbi:MAG: hypothetical protein AB7Q81_07190 [Gammaproteobacteria bacterium]
MSCATAFLFATEAEAAPLVEALAARPLAGWPAPVFGAGDVVVAIGGMGLDAARAAVERLAAMPALRRVVNLGIAGSLTDSLRVGDVLEVAEVCSEQPHAPAFVTTPTGGDRGPRVARLLSRDQPVFDPALRARLSALADLVDMEGYAVAAACAERGLDCVLLKSVSDDATDRAMLHANLARASRGLAACVLDRLEHFK